MLFTSVAISNSTIYGLARQLYYTNKKITSFLKKFLEIMRNTTGYRTNFTLIAF